MSSDSRITVFKPQNSRADTLTILSIIFYTMNASTDYIRIKQLNP